MSQQIPIANITGWENAKPRKALVKSMQDQGFLDEFPIIVATTDDGVYRLLDGRRRTAAAAQAGLKAVHGVISPAGAALTIMAHATRSENPVAELHAYQELQRAGLSEEQIARIGYARSPNSIIWYQRSLTVLISARLRLALPFKWLDCHR